MTRKAIFLRFVRQQAGIDLRACSACANVGSVVNGRAPVRAMASWKPSRFGSIGPEMARFGVLPRQNMMSDMHRAHAVVTHTHAHDMEAATTRSRDRWGAIASVSSWHAWWPSENGAVTSCLHCATPGTGCATCVVAHQSNTCRRRDESKRAATARPIRPARSSRSASGPRFRRCGRSRHWARRAGAKSASPGGRRAR